MKCNFRDKKKCNLTQLECSTESKCILYQIYKDIENIPKLARHKPIKPIKYNKEGRMRNPYGALRKLIRRISENEKGDKEKREDINEDRTII